jgi:hypothetical protein
MHCILSGLLINYAVQNNAGLDEMILANENYFVPVFSFDVMIFNITLQGC